MVLRGVENSWNMSLVDVQQIPSFNSQVLFLSPEQHNAEFALAQDPRAETLKKIIGHHELHDLDKRREIGRELLQRGRRQSMK